MCELPRTGPILSRIPFDVAEAQTSITLIALPTTDPKAIARTPRRPPSASVHAAIAAELTTVTRAGTTNDLRAFRTAPTHPVSPAMTPPGSITNASPELRSLD